MTAEFRDKIFLLTLEQEKSIRAVIDKVEALEVKVFIQNFLCRDVIPYLTTGDFGKQVFIRNCQLENLQINEKEKIWKKPKKFYVSSSSFSSSSSSFSASFWRLGIISSPSVPFATSDGSTLGAMFFACSSCFIF